jgi:hypothetical protein
MVPCEVTSAPALTTARFFYPTFDIPHIYMEAGQHYETVSEAITQLRSKGYTVDFNLAENCIVCHAGKFNPDEFEVAEIYRYEGDTDPADEATVFGIVSHSGLKGILVMGDDPDADSMTDDLVHKLFGK